MVKSAKPVPTAFTLSEALVLIRRVQPACMGAGYYVALAGGVLNKGYSENDLDLVFMPRTSTRNMDQLIYVLQSELGDAGPCTNIPGGLHVTFPSVRVEGTIVHP